MEADMPRALEADMATLDSELAKGLATLDSELAKGLATLDLELAKGLAKARVVQLAMEGGGAVMAVTTGAATAAATAAPAVAPAVAEVEAVATEVGVGAAQGPIGDGRGVGVVQGVDHHEDGWGARVLQLEKRLQLGLGLDKS